MRVRDHVALGTAGAAALRPWLGRRVLGFWAGSLAIDGDHYVWFWLTRRRASPLAALRFFNAPEPPTSSTVRILHQPLALLLMSLAAARHRRARMVVTGMTLHVALDAYHERRMNRARTAALRRDDYACRACGSRNPPPGTHLWRQPIVLPSYRSDYHVTLCRTCHDAAHHAPLRASRGREQALLASTRSTR